MTELSTSYAAADKSTFLAERTAGGLKHFYTFCSPCLFCNQATPFVDLRPSPLRRGRYLIYSWSLQSGIWTGAHIDVFISLQISLGISASKSHVLPSRKPRYAELSLHVSQASLWMRISICSSTTELVTSQTVTLSTRLSRSSHFFPFFLPLPPPEVTDFKVACLGFDFRWSKSFVLEEKLASQP